MPKFWRFGIGDDNAVATKAAHVVSDVTAASRNHKIGERSSEGVKAGAKAGNGILSMASPARR